MQADLPSDSDSNDSDYRPNCRDSDSDESIDEKDELLDDTKNEENGNNKNAQKSRKKSRKQKKDGKDVYNEEIKNTEIFTDPEEEKKRIDALWADFLGNSNEESDRQLEKKTIEEAAKKEEPQKPQVRLPEKKIFEFAGETVEVTSNDSNEGSLEASKTTEIPANTFGLKRPNPGGLSSVLNQFSKKNKLSILEKTKLDWDGFKSSEGISEELKTHNRGRDGFLERRDFLERTDLKQFEIEKNLRMTSRRSK